MGLVTALSLIGACAYASAMSERTVHNPLPLYDVLRFYARHVTAVCVGVALACFADGAPMLLTVLYVALSFWIIDESRIHHARPSWFVLGAFFIFVVLLKFEVLMFCGAATVIAVPIIGVNAVSILHPPPQWTGDTEELTKWWYDLRDGNSESDLSRLRSERDLRRALRLAHYVEWTGAALMLAVGI